MTRERESKSASRHHRHHKSSSSSSKKSKKHKKSSSDDRDLPHGVSAISEDDYFLRATEFRVWLAKTKDKYVEDLSTEEATSLFCGKFVKKWNRGQLDSMYYRGIPEHVLEQTKRTKHTWGFVKKLDEKEVFALATARDSVGVATRKSDLLVSSSSATAKPLALEPERTATVSGPSRHRHQQDKGSSDEDREKRSHKRKSHHHREKDSESDDDGERHHRHRSSHKAERKKHRKHHESVLEELAPKETGREALLEKRRQIGSKLHGAARDREENRDGLNLSEDFLMGGGGGSDLQRRLKQREQVRDRKQQEAQEKLSMFEAKESARMDKFLQDMGISATSKPFTIAPRK